MRDETTTLGPGMSARAARVVVRTLVAVFVAYFLTLCVLKWRAHGYGDFDLVIFDQAVWNTAHLNTPFASSVRFGSVFADHVPLILGLCVPLYWLFGWLLPGALILLALQALALGAAAFPLRHIGRRLAGEEAGVAVAAAYLLHPATGYAALFEFHPGVLAVPFLCWMLWALLAERWRTYVVCMALALACREDVALTVAGTGAYALWHLWRAKRSLRTFAALRWCVVPVAVALVWFVVAVKVIVPAAQPDGHPDDASPFVQLYAHLVETPGGPVSVRDVAGAVAAHPVRSFERAAALPQKHIGAYTRHLVAPTAGLALLSPAALVPALPLFALNALSSKAETSSICYQYAANLLPLLFLATACSLAWLGRRGPFHARPWLLPAALVSAALVTNASWGKAFSPLRDPLAVGNADPPHQLYRTRYVRDHIDAAKEALAAEIPPNAPVVATFDLLHRLPMREELYSWHYVRSGHDPITGAPVVTPSTQFALLDLRDALTFAAFGDGGSGERQRSYLADFDLIAQLDSVVLLRRGDEPTADTDGDGGGLTQRAHLVVRAGNPPTGPLDWRATGLAVRVVGVAALPGPALTGLAGTRVLSVHLAWSAHREFLAAAARETDGFATNAALWARFVVAGPSGDVYDRVWPLDLGMVPLAEWHGFDAASEREPHSELLAAYPLLLPPDLPAGSYGLRCEVRPQPSATATVLASAGLGSFRLP